jgi:transcription termination factor Rho
MNPETSGLLEIDRKGSGYLRTVSLNLRMKPDDPHVGADLVRRFALRQGVVVSATLDRPAHVKEILRVNDLAPDEWRASREFSTLTAITPHVHIRLEGKVRNLSSRMIDLFCPLGKGQRGLIVSPPKAGKTMLLQELAHSISTNNPEIDLTVLLIDERPEEVTDMQRSIKGQVFASSSDSERGSHVRLAQLVLDCARRKVEAGRDAVLLLDSLTRLGRAFNLHQRGTGRTLSGGVDARALEIPKRIFGAARAAEGGGSLTILATALIETNSRMDELIFEEFKGTGNMELVLDRKLADERLFPAINLKLSGTRREELLFGDDWAQHQLLRRSIARKSEREALLAVRKLLEQYPSNQKLLAAIS